MDTFLFPIILASIISAGLVLVLARLVDEALFFSITSFLILLCFGLILYSFFLGSWKSMNLATIGTSVVIGLTAGVMISPWAKKM
ncbi:hypothetical protein KFZ58_04435 [Virgibacillus sp. NKC19-16]|uniref:hypothetical protein n=1 Tax=Virgibacillus salidurans TaxID=2831673 RepID=UPI001F459220|nr:hypothetical protein [Virgibacillus sp. NKC19-16]UJL47171.1 hypothetical protein KFZ58_04435 [Virgibacillus sp. NKC19-16]